MVNPKSPKSFDQEYWRQNYPSRSYFNKNSNFEDFQFAYKVGHEGCDRYVGKSFDEAEPQLKQDYENVSASESSNHNNLPWEQVKDAVRDAWDQAATT
jgi:hypothetical protein